MMSPASPGIPGSLSPIRDLPFPSTAARGPRGLRSSAKDWAVRLAAVVLSWRGSTLVAIHVLVFAVTYLLAYAVRFDGSVPPAEWRTAIATLPLVIGVKLAAFLATKSHRGWWRYNGFDDIVHLSKAVTLGSAALAIASYYYQGGPPIPRSVILIDWAGTLLVVGGGRGGTRLFRERYYPMVTTARPKRVLIIGASEAGAALIHAIRGQSHLGMRVVGILDSDRSIRGRTLAGVKVLGSPDDIERYAVRSRAATVLVPMPAIPPAKVRALVTACTAAGLKVQVVPGFDAILNGTLTVQPRDVDIHDLLCREPVQLDGESIGRFLRGRVVLVTGAAGSIGSEICRQALRFRPDRLILLDHSENGLFFIERELLALAEETEVVSCVASITDARRLQTTFDKYRPEVVFHAAAHKHVPMMEANPGEAVKNNVFGTRILTDVAVNSGVEAFVMISSDKAVRPSSVMGACKRLAEMYVQELASHVSARLVTVRFGNVLGSSGSVVPLFKEQIRRGGPVTVTHPDMTRYFMTIPEAAQLVLQAGALGRGGEIFVLDMGEPVKVVNLARDLIRLSGAAEGREVEIVITGLRPGEKLHEELYDSSEERLATPHPKIFAAKCHPCSLPQIQAKFDRLARVVECPADEVIVALKELVPNYGYGRRDIRDGQGAMLCNN